MSKDSAAQPDAARQAAEYFDSNTKRFMKWGEGGDTGAIHRALWAPTVSSVSEAIDHVNILAAEALAPGFEGYAHPHTIDLGCGTGASAMRLADLLDTRVTGITVSAVQADLAKQLANERGLGERCNFVLGDFLAPPPMEPVHGAVAVEAFVLASDGRKFFEVTAGLMEPGARLVIIDDVLTSTAEQDPKGRLAVARFRRGWRLSSLVTAAELIGYAESAGFALVTDRNLTPWIRLRRPRDRAIKALVKTFGWIKALERWPAWGNFLGGDALQDCLGNRWVEYHLLSFRKL